MHTWTGRVHHGLAPGISISTATVFFVLCLCVHRMQEGRYEWVSFCFLFAVHLFLCGSEGKGPPERSPPPLTLSVAEPHAHCCTSTAHLFTCPCPSASPGWVSGRWMGECRPHHFLVAVRPLRGGGLTGFSGGLLGS